MIYLSVECFLLNLFRFLLELTGVNANNEECSVFLSIYEFFIDVSYLPGDSERFSVSIRRYWTRIMLCVISRKRQDGG